MIKIPERQIVWGAVALMALLLFGNQGFRQFWSLFWEKRHLEQAVTQLRADHAAQTQELRRLVEDPSYTEYLIRKNLGYVKKGEVEYRILTSTADGG